MNARPEGNNSKVLGSTFPDSVSSSVYTKLEVFLFILQSWVSPNLASCSNYFQMFPQAGKGVPSILPSTKEKISWLGL